MNANSNVNAFPRPGGEMFHYSPLPSSDLVQSMREKNSAVLRTLISDVLLMYWLFVS